MPYPTGTPTEENRSLVRELSHELRDALSPLAPLADLARLRQFDPETSRLLAEMVERGLRRTLAILDTFVLAEQCESGALPLTLHPIPLDHIVHPAAGALGELRRRFRFITPGSSARAQADPERSVQLLTAVLQHAAAVAAPDSLVEVEVAESAAQPQIRVHFASANTSGNDWFASYCGGEGGMALRTARQLMTLQGGALELVKSGTDKWVLLMQFAGEGVHTDAPGRESLPPQPAEPLRRAEASDAAAGRRILIVDDSLDVRRAYREALAAAGYSVLEAADAEQALSVIESSRPQVALIDIHLPRMNGYRLAQAVRARAGAAIYLVMLSGMALDTVTRDLAREAGFDDCLDKMAGPVALRELLAAGAKHSC